MYVAVCECGWRSTRMSEAKAAFTGRQHSCERFARDAARAVRVAERKAASGPIRECSHPIAHHEHGTHAAYVLDLCRCRPCRDAASQYERWRGKQRAYGREAYVDAGPAREHVRSLMSQGLGLKRIVILSGISQGVLWKLVYGKRRADGTQVPSKRIRPATEAALLALDVTLDNLGQTVSVDATGTHRRLQALVTQGWSQSKLAVSLGMDATNLWGVMHRPMVHAETARKVRVLYDELWKVAPPEGNQRERIAASRARNYAAARGWKPPLWWDEDEIDLPVIPDQAPVGDDLDHIAVERAMQGEQVRLTRDERDEAVRRLLALGHNKTEIARRLRLSGSTVDSLLTVTENVA